MAPTDHVKTAAGTRQRACATHRETRRRREQRVTVTLFTPLARPPTHFLLPCSKKGGPLERSTLWPASERRRLSSRALRADAVRMRGRRKASQRERALLASPTRPSRLSSVLGKPAPDSNRSASTSSRLPAAAATGRWQEDLMPVNGLHRRRARAFAWTRSLESSDPRLGRYNLQGRERRPRLQMRS